MHLLLAQKGAINEGDEAVDLGQEPADVVFLSAADTEIAAMAAAYELNNCNGLSLRLANLMQLSHPMSVDVYAQNTTAKSRLVIVRVLGGVSYWAYGLEKLHALACENNVQLVIIPGDDKPDPQLQRFCTVPFSSCQRVSDYLVQGGPDNMARLLDYCQFLLGKGA